MSKHEIIIKNSVLPVYFDVHETTNHIVSSHYHEHIEVIYIMQGQMKIILNGEEYTLKNEDIFLLNSGDIHYTKSLGNVKLILLQIPLSFFEGSNKDISQIRFSQIKSQEPTEQELNEELLKEDLLNKGLLEDRLKIIILKMFKTYIEKEDGYKFLFNKHLNEFVYILYKFYLDEKTLFSINNEKVDDRVRRIIRFVEDNYKEPITSSLAAEKFSLNHEYFCRLFKKKLGFTFVEYVNMMRLSHIYYEILNTDKLIYEIMQSNGFTNAKVFYRMFKKEYGKTPKQIRELKG